MTCSVLIVDDHPGFRARARALLVAAGYEVVGEAADGESGVRMARDLSPDLVLLDVQLPDITGFEVVRRVHSEPGPPAIVLISSRDACDYGSRIRRSGALGFISKSRADRAGARGRARGIPPMTRRRWGLLALAVAVAGWILGAEWVSIHHGVPENHFIDALTGLAFLAGGLVALDRRPGNAIGSLMIAFAVVSYVGNWGNIDVPVLPLLGASVGQWAATPILAQIALSYPDGRLRTTFDRVVIGLVYLWAISICVVILLVYDPRSEGCPGCAWEPAPFASRQAFDAATSVAQQGGAILAVLFLLAVGLRFRRATPAARRDLTPLWVAVCILAIIYLLGAFASPDPLHDPFAYLLWELQGVLEISLPVIFVWGLLSARLARSAVGDLVVELERPLLPGELQASLARTLGDPSLELLYAVDGHEERWVDASGRPGSLPPQARETSRGR